MSALSDALDRRRLDPAQLTTLDLALITEIDRVDGARATQERAQAREAQHRAVLVTLGLDPDQLKGLSKGERQGRIVAAGVKVAIEKRLATRDARLDDLERRLLELEATVSVRQELTP